MLTLKSDEVENLREQNQRLQEHLHDCERLHRILQTICSSLKVDEILQHIIDEAMSLCRAQQATIMLFESAGLETAKTLIRHGEAAGNKLDHYLNNLLAGWVSQNSRPLLTTNLRETFGPDDIPPKYNDIAAALSIPIKLHGHCLGVINLLALAPEPGFGERELHLMEILTDLAAQFIVNARLHESLFAEAQRLQQEVQGKHSLHGLIGHSPSMQQMFALLQKVIPTEGRILLEGESGTGKERVARAIHYNGPRQDKPFVPVDCGALPANLFESELFGYVKGAFTGAVRDKKGLFEAASGGTLFLDEIVNMPLEIQSKFLRAIQEGEIRPLGGTQIRKVDVRIIAAANCNLRAEVDAGRFRQDLFFRLNVVNIVLPPLRERKQDILILARHFLNEKTAASGKKIHGFNPETVACFELHSWPGNVRELEQTIERMIILAEPNQEMLTPDLLPLEMRPHVLDNTEPVPAGVASDGVNTTKDAYEKMLLLENLVKHDWNQSAAARAMGLHEATLRFKMKKFGIKKS